MWMPWRDWAIKKAAAEVDKRHSRQAIEMSNSELGQVDRIAQELRTVHRDAVAEQVYQAFRVRPPKRGRERR